MKVHAIGVSRRFGTSQKTNNRYDIARLQVLVDQRPSANQNSTFQAAGFRAVEYDLEPAQIEQFLNVKYPAEIEVTTESRPTQSGMVAVVTGIQHK